MTAHLLQLALGPVQEFIAAARRTRDLWFGSYLLSEISKAAAKAVREHGGNLIFPAPLDGTDLEPESSLSVANIILAEIHEHDPETIARSAKEAAQNCWLSIAGSVLKDRDYDGIEHILQRTIWDEQITGILEFYSAWVPFTPQNYAAQRKRVARLIAARKNCRNFEQAVRHPGLPKSSLDGLRETVFREGDRKTWPRKVRNRLRVRPGEQLDVVGLVKRIAEGHRPYPSGSRIAADPWLRGVIGRERDLERLSPLCKVCESLSRDELLHKINTERLHDDYKAFRFEGTAVYRSRHHELIEETDETEDRLIDLRAALAEVERLAAQMGLGAEPDPYLAVLVADGDQMGKAIDAIAQFNGPGKHRDFSRELSKFAVDAERVVRKHHGVLIYSGGDDVLAFVPVDRVLKCARELYEAFAKTMSEALNGIEVKRPTLSVGVAIAHFNEHLEDLLDYGRAAEKAAKKPDRDGLAVHLHKRGGAPVKVRKQWRESLDVRLAQAGGWFLAGAVSNRTPYELDRLADVYDEWPEQTLAEAIKADAARVIDRKRPKGTDDQMHQILDALRKRVRTPSELRTLAAELLIARHLAVSLRQSGGKSQ